MNPLRIVAHPVLSDRLAPHLSFPHRFTVLRDLDDSAVAQLMGDTDAVVSALFKSAWRPPAGSPLKMVHSTGAGTDGIDFSVLPAGCVVCNVYGHERGVAEQAFLLMLAHQRKLFMQDRALRKGDWSMQYPVMPELRGRHILIVGFGHIGRELVRWAKFLDMAVTVVSRTAAPERGADLGVVVEPLGSLASALPRADFVVIAVPAAKGSVDLIGARELSLMKPSAFLVNVGRGPVVNEAALYEALRSGRIAGAGLDVWYQYPAAGENRMPSQLPYQELDNVIMSPHKPTFETLDFRASEIAENLRRLAAGESLRNVVHRA